MPMFKALDACPDAVVIRPNMAKYEAVGREIRERMRALTPLVEPLSIDEAFLDLTGTERLHHASAAETLVRFIRALEDDIGISASVGLAPNKFLAKLSSDLEKPRGFSVVDKAEAKAFLAPKPVSMIWGVGKVLQQKLAADGIRTIGQLQLVDPDRSGAPLWLHGPAPGQTLSGRRRPASDPGARRQKPECRDHLQHRYLQPGHPAADSARPVGKSLGPAEGKESGRPYPCR